MQYTEPRPQPESFPTPNEGQNVKPQKPESEVVFGENGSEAEVDMDKEKIKKFPKTNPPESF